MKTESRCAQENYLINTKMTVFRPFLSIHCRWYIDLLLFKYLNFLVSNATNPNSVRQLSIIQELLLIVHCSYAMKIVCPRRHQKPSFKYLKQILPNDILRHIFFQIRFFKIHGVKVYKMYLFLKTSVTITWIYLKMGTYLTYFLHNSHISDK